MGKIIIPASAIVALKTLRFEIEDRARYGTLPVLATLQALDAVKLNYMHDQRTNNVVDKANFSALRKCFFYAINTLSFMRFLHRLCFEK